MDEGLFRARPRPDDFLVYDYMVTMYEVGLFPDLNQVFKSAHDLVYAIRKAKNRMGWM